MTFLFGLAILDNVGRYVFKVKLSVRIIIDLSKLNITTLFCYVDDIMIFPLSHYMSQTVVEAARLNYQQIVPDIVTTQHQNI